MLRHCGSFCKWPSCRRFARCDARAGSADPAPGGYLPAGEQARERTVSKQHRTRLSWNGAEKILRLLVSVIDLLVRLIDELLRIR